jgi:hypothetical protein
MSSSKFLREHDDTVNPKQRGQSKSGGALLPAESRGSSTRPRKPIEASLSSKVSFKRYRNIKTLSERLAEISKLKKELAQAKLSTLSDQQDVALEATRSSLSNQLVYGGIATLSQPSPLSINTSLEPSTGQLQQLDFARVFGGESDAASLYEQHVNSLSSKRSSAPNARQLQSPSGKSREETIKQLQFEEIAVDRKLLKLTQAEDAASSLKQHEANQKALQRSRDIERKRRLLSDKESKHLGPPMEGPNVYDFYATALQSATRGWLVRRWVRWYKEVSRMASIAVQSLIRGWLARLKIRRMRIGHHAATVIQKIFRGWISRVSADIYYIFYCYKAHALFNVLIREQALTWQGRKTS